MAIDSSAMFAMSYGLFVVSAESDGLKAGCVVNTAVQVTAEPIRMSVAVHKDNVTAGVIKSAGAFTVTAIDQTADMPYIGNFGFRTSDTYDKFAKYETAVSEVGSPYCPEHACAVYGCRLIDTVDVGTHLDGKLRVRGVALVPLELYFNEDGRVKLLLGLGRGKKLYDKREDMAKRDMQREIDRALKQRSR